MKKILTQLGLLLTLIVLLASCKKDDENSSASLTGKWYQVRETRQASVDNKSIGSLTITNFNNVNYMNFKPNRIVEIYSPKGVSISISGDNSSLQEFTDDDSEMEEYSYNIDENYVTFTKSSQSAKATIKTRNKSSLIFQVENSFKHDGKVYVSNTEVEYRKQ